MQRFTSTINMLITALALGYCEIYLVGLDFYTGGGAKYAFDSNKKNLVQCLPSMADENSVDLAHSKDIDIMGLKLAQDMPGVKLYSLAEGSILADYVPLAPVMNANPMQPEDKASNALKDFADLPRARTNYGPVRKFVEKHNLWPEYEKLKDNIYMHALYDLINLFKMAPLVLKKIFFPSPEPKNLKKKRRKNHEK